MGIFSLFRKKQPPTKTVSAESKAPPLEPKTELEPVKKVPATEMSPVSWSVWGKEVTDVRMELAKEHGFAVKKGLRMLVYSYEPWSPGSVGFKEFGQHPLGLARLQRVHVVEVNLNHMDAMQTIGMGGGGIPQVWAMEADGSYAGNTVSGAVWGADTAGNIDRAMERWFAQLGWK